MPNLFQLHLAALKDFARNNCPYMAAGIAYWGLFSLFPLALALMSLSGFLLTAPEDQAKLVDAAVRLLPVSADYIGETVGDVVRLRGALGAVAFGAALLAGTAVFSAIRKGVNHAWHIGRPPYFLVERAIDMGMMLAVGSVVMVCALSSIVELRGAPVAGAQRWFTGTVAGRVLLDVGLLALTFGLLAVLYRVAPNTTVRWREVWLGALVAAVWLQALRLGFGWFVGQFGNFNVVYGSLGGLVALLTWAYVAALGLLWGAQLCYTGRLLAEARALADLADGDQRAPGRREAARRGALEAIAGLAGWVLPRLRRSLP